MKTYRAVPLTSGDITIVDIVDYPYVVSIVWHLSIPPGSISLKYARGWVDGHNQYLHRVLLEPPQHLDIDHKNGNGLDNRRENLRPCTESQNLGGRKINANNTSGYKGVHWLAAAGKWRVRIGNGTGGRRSLGLYTDLHEAARAYNCAALAQWGEFARLNEIPNKEGR